MSSLVDIDWRITLWNRMLDEAHQTEDTRREADLLFQQNQLLTEIKNRMEDKKSKCQMTESDDTESTLNKSMRSLYRPILTSRKSMADITGFPQSRSRFSSNITTDHIRLRRKVAPSTDQVEDMLEEVRLKCNFDTYETASWMVQNMKELGRKLTEHDDDIYQLERERKAHQQSRAQLQQLQKKLNEATKRLKILEDFVGSKEAAERDRKNSHANLQEREKILMRSQASVVIKEKLLSENSKKQNAKVMSLLISDGIPSENVEVVQGGATDA